MNVLKGKIKTYALVLLVLTIWAIIAVQILNAFNPSEEVSSDLQPSSGFELQKLKTRDTFNIRNNYRNPFSGKLTAGTSKNKTKTAPKPQKEPVPFPIVNYHGMISDAAGGGRVFSLSVDQQEILLSVGEAYQELRLSKGDASQIVLEYKGKRKTLKK